MDEFHVTSSYGLLHEDQREIFSWRKEKKYLGFLRVVEDGMVSKEFLLGHFPLFKIKAKILDAQKSKILKYYLFSKIRIWKRIKK